MIKMMKVIDNAELFMGSQRRLSSKAKLDDDDKAGVHRE